MASAASDAETTHTVLLAEDDLAIAEPLVRALRREGYDVEATTNGADAVRRLERGGVDLLVLDLGLPDIDGFEVCRQIRAAGNPVPVLILTARADEVDTVVGLDAGADDYVTKPFRLAELLARARAVVRRGTADAWAESANGGRRNGGKAPEPGTPAEPSELSSKGVTLDVDSRRAWLQHDELQLTAKEFDLLRVLMRQAGVVVTRQDLMREVWDTTWWTSTKTLDMHVSWLRRKLGDDATHPRFITTVRGVGFRFETE